MKYILVTGGVISGIGKGVIASSIGTLLKSHGVRMTSIKIDPYINIDAGTFSPYEHGEVFVLDDGGEVDLDLGNYERFMNITLHRDNNITTGKIYKEVIERERRGDYLGKTVQVIPHITDSIQDWVQKVAKIPVDSNDNAEPEVCIIELGGTIGDIEGMPFVEAFRQFQRKVKKENFCVVHVSLLPEPKSTGDQKTKPTQASVRELRGFGLSPDLIMARCMSKLTDSSREKISTFCDVTPECVIGVCDVTSVYWVPPLLEDNNLVEYFRDRLQLPLKRNSKALSKWRELAIKHDRLHKEIHIALVGKYTKLEDAYASVIKALQHASMKVDHRLVIHYINAEDLESISEKNNSAKYHEAWHLLCSSDGVLVPGGFGVRGMEGKISAAEWARKNKKPYLGVCLGMQCAVIEFCRNVLGLLDANTTEVDDDTKKTSVPVVIEMPEHHTGKMGGTMRLGKRQTNFTVDADKSIIRKLYDDCEFVEERHRHRYEVNPEYVAEMEKKGLKFVGHSTDGKRMEIMELENHPFFVAVQYHPEYISRPLLPSAPYLGLLLAACGRLDNYLNKGCKFSPGYTDSSGVSESDDEDDLNTTNKSLNKKLNNLVVMSNDQC